MVLKIRVLKKKWAGKDRSFWVSLGLHLFIIALLILTIPKTPKTFQISGPAKVNIVNATFIAPSQALVPQNVPVPPPPAPAPKPIPKPVPAPRPQIKPAPKPVEVPRQAKPQPKPAKPLAKPAPRNTPVIQAKQAEVKKPAPPQQRKKHKDQDLAAVQKAAALKKQQAAAAALKAMALSSIQSSVQTQQQQAEAAAAQQRLTTLKEQYMALIQQTIRANWINQFNPSQDLTATLQINLDTSGNVLSVSLLQSSGNPTFDRQAILAVRKSSPLPLPQDPELIKDFLSLILPFSNQGAS